MTWLLNDSSTTNTTWRQNLELGDEVDEKPVLTSTHSKVYNHEGDSTYEYSNYEQIATLSNHNYPVSVSYTGQPAPAPNMANFNTDVGNTELTEEDFQYTWYQGQNTDASAGVEGLTELSVAPTTLGLYTLKVTQAATASYTPATLLVNVEIIKGTGALEISDETIAKSYGDSAFSLNCSTNGDGAIAYAVTDSKNASGQVVAKDQVITVDKDGNVTIVGAGTATITVSLAEGANYNAAEPKTITVIVAKNDTFAVKAIKHNYVYAAGSNGKTIKEDIAALLPEDCGAVTYSLSSNSAAYVTDEAVSTEGELTYQVGTTGKAGDTTTLTVTAKSDNYEDISVDVEITLVDKITPTLKEGSKVAIKGSNEVTYGQKLNVLTFDSVTFEDAMLNVNVPGTLAWTNGDTIPSMGTTKAEWTFTPENQGSYKVVTGEVPIALNKATPTVSAPTVEDVIYNPSTTLADVMLNGAAGTCMVGGESVTVEGSWAWKTGDTVPTVNNDGYVAVFIPTDEDNYESVEKTVTVTITMATPVVGTLPVASSISYGQALSSSELSDGIAVYNNEEGAATVAGTFAWSEAAVKPTVADSNKTEYEVTFTPTDTDNYNGFTAKVKVTVNKLTNAPNMPDSTMTPDHTVKTVGDIALSEDWVWSEADVTSTLTDGEAVKATAIYNGTDKGNYENESVEVTITRTACDHKNTEVRNKRVATCTKKGYTGDTYCKVCGEKIATGKEVNALSHKWGAWKVTTPASYNKEGVETRECSVCHKKETRAIKKLTKPKDYAKKGKTYTVSKMKYKVTSVAGNGTGTVAYTGTTKSKNSTSFTIGSTVKIKGKTFKITAIGDKAFKNFKKLKKVTIGAYVTTIGKEAFYGCKLLKTITIKSKKLKKVGKYAIRNIYKKATIKVPGSKVNAYKKLFKSSTGFKKSMKIKK